MEDFYWSALGADLSDLEHKCLMARRHAITLAGGLSLLDHTPSNDVMRKNLAELQDQIDRITDHICTLKEADNEIREARQREQFVAAEPDPRITRPSA